MAMTVRPSQPLSVSGSADADDLPIIDAHHHYWDLSLGKHPWLNNAPYPGNRYGDYRGFCVDFMPDDYRRASGRHRIVGNVYMEAEWDHADPIGETRWIHDLAAREGVPHAMIAQAWLDRDDVAEVLAAQASFELVRAIRHKPKGFAKWQDWRPDHGLPGSMLCPRYREGYARLADLGLHFELQTNYWHLPDAADLARAFPHILMVINHTGLPGDRRPDTLERWQAAMAVVAACPNVMVKISGLGVPGEAWTVEANRYVVRETIALFGVERCMFASNYPVDSLFRSLEGIFDDFKAITADFSRADRLRLFHDNAKAVYRLNQTEETHAFA
jgi:predicted TIM-barrel fold metal-dependent hydrolase